VLAGNTITFAAQPDPGYDVWFEGNCNGVLTDNVYTTYSIVGDCTASAIFYPRTHVVTPVGAAHATISPDTPFLMSDVGRQTLTVTADAGYLPTIFIGNCHGMNPILTQQTMTATLYGITKDCTVTAGVVPTITLSSDKNPAVYGQGLTLTATLFDPAYAGSVSFYRFAIMDPDIYFCANVPVSNGVARCTLDADHVMNTSTFYASFARADILDPVSVASISPSHVFATTTSLTIPANAVDGTPIQLQATVTPDAAYSGPAPTGTITIEETTDGVSCSYSLSAANPGCSITPSAGNKNISVRYSGDERLAASSATATLKVAPLPQQRAAQSSTDLSSDTVEPVAGTHIQLTATVNGASPSGQVDFADDTKPLCSGVPLVVTANTAIAACTISTLDVGVHHIQASYTGDASNLPSTSPTVRQIVVTPTPVNLNQFGLTGAWYNPATSGQGVLFNALPNIAGAGSVNLFGAWFTYDTLADGVTGVQRWYTIQGMGSAGNAYATLTIYEVTGGLFNTPPAVGGKSIGKAVLQFSDCSHGVLSYEFSDQSGRQGNIPLSRLDANVSCSSNGAGGSDTSGTYLLSGGWYTPATSGQGLLFTINPVQDIVFGGWFTFSNSVQSADASQRWYSLQIDGFTPGTTSRTNVPIYRSVGGSFAAPAPVATTQVGTADIAFTACDKLTLKYTFSAGENQGQTGTIDLVRAGPIPTGCNL
jgi:hypothetical protein